VDAGMQGETVFRRLPGVTGTRRMSLSPHAGLFSTLQYVNVITSVCIMIQFYWWVSCTTFIYKRRSYGNKKNV